MPFSGLWLVGRAVLLSLIITFATPGALQLLPIPQQTTAEATVSYGKNDDKGDKDKEEKEKDQKQKAEKADRVLDGQVLEINTLKDPPELIVGSVDGQTLVRVLKTDEIVRNGVRVGDYIEADGEKIHEQLFEATKLSVSAHFADNGNDNGH